MSKRPKYKRGYTWSHHFDEWWDRAGEEFKIKLFLALFAVAALAGVTAIYFWHHAVEKRELLEAIQQQKDRNSEPSKEETGLNSGGKSASAANWNSKED